MKQIEVTAIIVTHNSSKELGKCMESLRIQSHKISKIVLVDSGSDTTEYLEKWRDYQGVSLLQFENIGYAQANNAGCKQAGTDAEYILFLNPDTFLTKDFIENAISIMEMNPKVGSLSGMLLGYDLDASHVNGKIDSTGVFRKMYGRWYDRGRGEPVMDQYTDSEEVPALCGALLFCRKEALLSLGTCVFDPEFFLYKEDIEFSLRLRKKGWKLYYCGELKAYHCRGWHDRREIPHSLKLTAAKSELLLYKKHPSPYIVWAFIKYWLVYFFRI